MNKRGYDIAMTQDSKNFKRATNHCSCRICLWISIGTGQLRRILAYYKGALLSS